MGAGQRICAVLFGVSYAMRKTAECCRGGYEIKRGYSRVVLSGSFHTLRLRATSRLSVFPFDVMHLEPTEAGEQCEINEGESWSPGGDRKAYAIAGIGITDKARYLKSIFQ